MSCETTELVPGSLDLQVLQTLTSGAQHGYGIVRRLQDLQDLQDLQETTDDAISVEEGSLYPALHRMESRGWVASDWRASENDRRARYYRLTSKGRRHLAKRVSAWRRLVKATQAVLSLTGERS